VAYYYFYYYYLGRQGSSTSVGTDVTEESHFELRQKQ